MSQPRENWFRDELERAKARLAELPPHARPVLVKRQLLEEFGSGCRCGHPGSGCVCHAEDPC